MSTLLIEGGHRLEGRVAVEGNKNAALPLLAACLLTEDECVLTNVPRIGDVVRFAARVARRVEAEFGVRLRPEPVFLGFAGGEAQPDVDYLLGARD